MLRVNAPNLGVAVDAFDVLASGVPLDDVDLLDPDQTFLVQVSDYMWQRIRSTEEQVATATHFRVFPGEGAHSEALAQFISRLDTIGYLGDYSFDVYNDDFLQMPPEAVVAARAARGGVARRDRAAPGASGAERRAPLRALARVDARDARPSRIRRSSAT